MTYSTRARVPSGINRVSRAMLTGIVILATLPLGCSHGSDAGVGRNPSPTIDKIKRAGVLRVGMVDVIPAQYRNPTTNDWEGYNVEMMRNLAEVLGVRLEIVNTNIATIIPGLMADEFDVAVDLFATPKRAAVVAFTNTYMEVGFSIIVRADLPLDKWDDLNNPDIAFINLAGTAAEPLTDEWFPLAKKRNLSTENTFAPQLEVAAGRSDAHVTDHISQVMFIKNNPGAKVRLLNNGEQRNSTGFAYAIKPGDWHLLNFLNMWITYNKSTGFSGKVSKKWYGFNVVMRSGYSHMRSFELLSSELGLH